ncbi:hypothetical protein QMP26_04945 [Enterocloster clostridioformis]
MKKGFLCMIIFLALTILAGCSNDKQDKAQSLSVFSDEVEDIEVTHLQGTLENEWTISYDQIGKLREWSDNLLFEEKQTQNPLRDITGIEKYIFDLGEEYTKVIYLIGDGKAYLQIGDEEWYEIKNPSPPPVDK